LGLDDRFLIHEYFGHIIGMNDAVILAALGLLEIALLLTWGDCNNGVKQLETTY
jgi:hypothetical protein